MCKRRRFDANAKIAELLIRAQNGSDGGKGRTVLVSSEKSVSDNIKGYAVKYSCIKESIKLIQEHNCAFVYYIIRDYKYNAKFIVSFVTHIEGQEMRVSFHCNISDLCPNCRRCPKSNNVLLPSYKAAECIYKYFCPLGKYCE